MPSNLPKIVAHRGASKLAAENSAQAIKLAIEHRADVVEFDVRLTKDGYFVLHHDAKVILNQKRRNISNSELCDLPELTTLHDALKLIKGQATVFIDAKGKDWAVKLSSALDEYSNTGNVVVISFNLKELNHFKSQARSITTIYLWRKYPKIATIYLAQKYGHDGVGFLLNLTLQPAIALAKAKNLQVYTYSTSSLQRIKSLKKHGVDFVGTNNIELFRPKKP